MNFGVDNVYTPNEVTAACITRDNRDEEVILKILRKFEVFTEEPTGRTKLLNTRDVCTSEIEESLLNAKRLGQNQFEKFVTKRLVEKTVNIKDRLPKAKAPTFATLYDVAGSLHKGDINSTNVRGWDDWAPAIIIRQTYILIGGIYDIDFDSTISLSETTKVVEYRGFQYKCSLYSLDQLKHSPVQNIGAFRQQKGDMGGGINIQLWLCRLPVSQATTLHFHFYPNSYTQVYMKLTDTIIETPREIIFVGNMELIYLQHNTDITQFTLVKMMSRSGGGGGGGADANRNDSLNLKLLSASSFLNLCIPEIYMVQGGLTFLERAKK
ncbi:hypothetical protein GQR58_015674 [Nymphon striatum]|nr:hypothetical protein GQR58_015674 [Nymphon striatum]